MNDVPYTCDGCGKVKHDRPPRHGSASEFSGTCACGGIYRQGYQKENR